MNLFFTRTIEELKKIGNIKKLRKELKELVGDNIKIKTKSWKDLLESIEALKRVAELINKIDSTQKEKSLEETGEKQKSEKEQDLYFKGEAEKYIFYLLELDGKARLDKLGVNKIHYSKKEIAFKWRNEIAKKIHPDSCVNKMAEKAMNELNYLYREMIS